MKISGLRRRVRTVLITLLLVTLVLETMDLQAWAARPTLYWGTRGTHVRVLQWRLNQWGYYRGPIDGLFGARTARAVRNFQWRNGLRVDGVVGPKTWAALGLGGSPTQSRYRRSSLPSRGVSRGNVVDLLARLIAAEARGEPYVGQVAVAAVILNRVKNPRFPKSVAGVIFQPGAFESVANGLIWRRTPTASEYRAARAALNGWDPTYGATFFWNPYKPVGSRWIWTRKIIVRLGRHVFGI